MAPVELSRDEARRIALTAQRFGASPPRVTPGQVRRLVATLGSVQIDAVNVLIRSHYLPIYSRLGSYPVRLLDGRQHLFEYWGHQASILPVELQPTLRWRMQMYAERWAEQRKRIELARPGYVAAILREVTERGPLTYSDLTDQGRQEKTQTRYAESSLLWHRWSHGKDVLDGLFNAGVLAAAGRRGFERLYDLAERVIPADIRGLPTPSREDAQRRLIAHSAAALGVATAKELADYFIIRVADGRARIRELVDAGELVPVRVDGWPKEAYLHPRARARPVDAAALLSPFDSLLWDRPRVERLFGFQHSFELYVPAAKRKYGYFVLPFLLGEQLVGRVDLKADRATSTLLVQAAHVEPGQRKAIVAAALRAELRRMADWLQLDKVTPAAAIPWG